jgi:Uma2 family endonuclease
MITLTKWTVENYHQMIDTGILNNHRVELINGEIIEMSPEGPFHHFVNLNVADYLRDLLGQKAIISEAHPITLDNSEPEPDIAIIHPPRIKYKNRHPYPEDIYWLIEIADSTRKIDLGIKKSLYARVEIPEYWVIDLKNQSLKIFQNPLDGDYQITKEYQDGIVYSLAFPEIEISVKKLIAIE